jgi:hypothetical protein
MRPQLEEDLGTDAISDNYYLTRSQQRIIDNVKRTQLASDMYASFEPTHLEREY